MFAIMRPPIAKKKPHRLEVHGDVRVDDYYWLRYRDDPDVTAYLEAENAYLDDRLGPHPRPPGAAVRGDQGPYQAERSVGAVHRG